MNELLVGYARASTEQQDLTAQRNGLHPLGVGDDRIYVDHGLTGTNRDRPGLTLALAACRAGDTLVVTKLDRLARWLQTKRNVRLSLGGAIHDPTDPRTAAIQRSRHGRGVRIRLNPITHPGRNESSESEGPAARQAAKVEAEPGEALAGAARLGKLHPSRARRTLRRRTINDLPHDRQDAPQAGRPASGHSPRGPCQRSTTLKPAAEVSVG
jgi:hypothetical protein